MKGGVAALVVAAEHLAATDAPGTVIIALVADEEDASIGAEAALEHLARERITADVCLIAEPTWLDLTACHRGFAVAEVTLGGTAAHSSQPHEGVDAIRALGQLLTSVADADARLGANTHPLLPPGSLMATVVRGGTAPFTIADSASATIERRTLPGETADELVDDITAMLTVIAARSPGLTTHVRLTHSRAAWEMDAAGPAAAFAELLADELVTAGAESPTPFGAPYWMESALWQAAGIPTVVCGPAGGGLHAVDEWVDIDQVAQFAVATAEAARLFLAGA